jgi:hypothetical protein
VDVGAPEVGLIATAITRWRGLVRRKAIVAAIICRIPRAGFFSGRQSMIQPFSGLAEDLILSVSSTISLNLRRRGRERPGFKRPP